MNIITLNNAVINWDNVFLISISGNQYGIFSLKLKMIIELFAYLMVVLNFIRFMVRQLVYKVKRI